MTTQPSVLDRSTPAADPPYYTTTIEQRRGYRRHVIDATISDLQPYRYCSVPLFGALTTVPLYVEHSLASSIFQLTRTSRTPLRLRIQIGPIEKEVQFPAHGRLGQVIDAGEVEYFHAPAGTEVSVWLIEAEGTAYGLRLTLNSLVDDPPVEPVLFSPDRL